MCEAICPKSEIKKILFNEDDVQHTILSVTNQVIRWGKINKSKCLEDVSKGQESKKKKTKNILQPKFQILVDSCPNHPHELSTLTSKTKYLKTLKKNPIWVLYMIWKKSIFLVYNPYMQAVPQSGSRAERCTYTLTKK